LWLGHVQPLRAYLLIHADEALSAQHVSRLLALLDRLRLMHAAIQNADSTLRQFGHV